MVARSCGKSMFSYVRNWRTEKAISKVALPFSFLPAMSKSPVDPYSYCQGIGFSHSNRCVVVFHCCFNFHFLNEVCWYWVFFISSCDILMDSPHQDSYWLISQCSPLPYNTITAIFCTNNVLHVHGFECST